MVWRKREAWGQVALPGDWFCCDDSFASFYHIGDIFHYYIPAYLAWAMWIGVGSDDRRSIATRRLTADRRLLFTVFCSLFTAALLIIRNSSPILRSPTAAARRKRASSGRAFCLRRFRKRDSHFQRPRRMMRCGTCSTSENTRRGFAGTFSLDYARV